MMYRSCLLIIAGGSSSVKFALFEAKSPALVISGKVAALDKENGAIGYSNPILNSTVRSLLTVVDHNDWPMSSSG